VKNWLQNLLFSNATCADRYALAVILQSNKYGKFKILRVVRLLRLAKLLRIFRAGRLVQRWGCDAS
jgi:hypothetical protein